ncbi:hypothetical protein L3X38_017082 [Prunus dulcis]|uniref:Uncharacterized protein n=1 Tax=Prunus dulcis TaxID=3755 RepID=A0AAD4W754_PRUDU|nr:hypothetical protein L3X38_017082 [Prunus dulcis]
MIDMEMPLQNSIMIEEVGNAIKEKTIKGGVLEIMDEGRPVSKWVKEGEDMNDFTDRLVGLVGLTHHEP